MRSAVLLYNPYAGRHPQRRVRLLEAVAHALAMQGVQTSLLATTAPGSAGAQARELRADVVFACGGDGTVHEVLQGMALHPTAALGILPVGTANILARDLRLPPDPIAAALAQIAVEPTSLPLGLLTCTTPSGPRERYFLVMAGAGPDGELVRESMRELKLQTGPAAYYLRAARLYALGRFPACSVEMRLLSGEVIERRAAGVMAFRIGTMGAAFGPRTPRGALHHPHLEVTLLKTPLRLAMLAWLAKGWFPLPGVHRYAECFQVQSVTASSGSPSGMQVQADGEWLGVTPMSLQVRPAALRMLLPPQP